MSVRDGFCFLFEIGLGDCNLGENKILREILRIV